MAYTVAVTGGAGFIGSHTVDVLLEGGHRVVVLDDFSTGKRQNLARWRNEPGRLAIVETNVEEGLWSALAPVVARWGPIQRFVHLAAQTSVVASIATPLCDLRVNLGGTVSVMEYARLTGADRVVFASSAAVYGDTETLPVTEDAPRRPLSPYGINKLSSEHYLAYAHDVHGLATVALRFFNVYGPRQDPSSPYSGVISIFFDRARRGMPITIFGDGEQTRDFVYVGDVARVVARACLEPGGEGRAFNVGTGARITVNELAAQVIGAMKSESPVMHGESRPGEIRHSQADISRARADLGFEPRVRVADGLAETAKWLATP